MTRRSLQASFAPGAYVFPGGQVDDADGEACIAPLRVGQERGQQRHAAAAIRETFEELGILLARNARGQQVTAETVRGLDRTAPLPAQCAKRGLVLSTDQVYRFAHWTTDRDLPRRFDVPFFVARMPQDQSPEADGIEQLEPDWIVPADAMVRHSAGTFAMLFPTVRTLERLTAYATVDEVLAACFSDDGAERPLWASCPRAGLSGGVVQRFMEHESVFGELEFVCPDGQPLHAVDWFHETVVPLRRGVARLTAPNGGPKTGPGTNTYLIGRPDTGYIVIDPGPADDGHVRRLFAATDGHIEAIVCTHSHPDHAPAARLLQDLCSAVGKLAPIMGLPSASTAHPASDFMPDQVVRDGEVIAVGNGDARYELEVVTTPGHAANHLCLLLISDGLAFSGDHVLNGSTSVIIPPDGNMTDYLDSLAKLEDRMLREQIDFIAPAHGYLIGDGRSAVRRLVEHRLQREAQVLAAMRELPNGSPEDWVASCYPGIDKALLPLARLMLLAHVERLQALAATPPSV